MKVLSFVSASSGGYHHSVVHPMNTLMSLKERLSKYIPPAYSYLGFFGCTTLQVDNGIWWEMRFGWVQVCLKDLNPEWKQWLFRRPENVLKAQTKNFLFQLSACCFMLGNFSQTLRLSKAQAMYCKSSPVSALDLSWASALHQALASHQRMATPHWFPLPSWWPLCKPGSSSKVYWFACPEQLQAVQASVP